MDIKNLRKAPIVLPNVDGTIHDRLVVEPGQTVTLSTKDADHPIIEAWLDAGYIEEIGGGESEGRGRKEKPGLTGMKAGEAADLIAATDDPGTLKAWAEADNRKSVLGAIEIRLEQLAGE